MTATPTTTATAPQQAPLPAPGRVVDLDLSGRRAVVTGGASGIGAACVRRLAAAGASVVIVDRDEPGTTSLAGELGAQGYVANLSEPDWLETLDPAVDVVINNAGLQHIAPVQDFSPDMFSMILRVMLEAPFRIAHRVLPHMYAAGWGRIINISSIHGHRASPYKAAYVSAKHGLEGLSKVIALEGGPHGVTSNTIAPAYVRTPLVERQIAAQAVHRGIAEAEVLDQIMLTRPVIKRLGEPAEVAEMVALLCSPAADFITGACLSLDGGWMAQ